MKNPLIILFLLIATCAGAQVVPQGFLRSHNTFTCGTSIRKVHVTGAVAPVDKTVTYSTVTNIPGEVSKCWITSNLGATNQATSMNDATEPSAGWYWQFNRKQGYKHDGSTRTPGGAWTNSISENSEWLPANDPCTVELGAGWRIPTSTEWDNVFTSGEWNIGDGPWTSGLKLHAAGDLHYTDGSLQNRGTYGDYWSSTQTSVNNARMLYVATNASQLSEAVKSWGYTLRCLRNLLPNVTTTAATSITSTTASSGGNVTDDGGSAITARGVCWSITTAPTITDPHTSDGTGTGMFTSTLSGLVTNTLYYVRAYTSNSTGTAYGNQVTCTTLTSFSIGQSYGGGIIFYIDGTGQHGLIAATSDQSSGAAWCLAPELIGGTSTAIGSGQTNTTAIVTKCTSSAAYICDILVLNGYNDWFLPSKDELHQLYLQRNLVGGFADDYYWSSSEYDLNDAWSHHFQIGFQGNLVKYNTYYLRAVRSF